MTAAAAFGKLLLHTPLAACSSGGTGPVRYFYVSGKRPLCPQNFGSVGVKC